MRVSGDSAPERHVGELGSGALVAEIIRFPDGELFLIELLKPRIAPVKVASLVPKQHTQSDKLVRVSRTGGPTKDLVTDGGTYLIECYAASVGDAYAFCAGSRQCCTEGCFLRNPDGQQRLICITATGEVDEIDV